MGPIPSDTEGRGSELVEAARKGNEYRAVFVFNSDFQFVEHIQTVELVVENSNSEFHASIPTSKHSVSGLGGQNGQSRIVPHG